MPTACLSFEFCNSIPAMPNSRLAIRARRILVGRSSLDGIPSAPTNLQANIEEGDKLFGTECAGCHGLDGHKPIDAGQHTVA